MKNIFKQQKTKNAFKQSGPVNAEEKAQTF